MVQHATGGNKPNKHETIYHQHFQNCQKMWKKSVSSGLLHTCSFQVYIYMYIHNPPLNTPYWVYQPTFFGSLYKPLLKNRDHFWWFPHIMWKLKRKTSILYGCLLFEGIMKWLTLVNRTKKLNPGSHLLFFDVFDWYKMMVHPSTVYFGMVCHGMAFHKNSEQVPFASFCLLW